MSLVLIHNRDFSSFPVFGISQDLGTITSTQKPVVWAVGFTRDQAVQYTDLSGVAQNRSLYYKANFTTDGALVSVYFPFAYINIEMNAEYAWCIRSDRRVHPRLP